MRLTIAFFASLLVLNSYSQESKQEFIEVIVEGKQAYMSTTTGEVIFREHATTDASAFITDVSGTTFYIETKIHKVEKGDVLASIAKKYKTTVDRLKNDNKLKTANLSINQTIKIKKTLAVESLKPTMSSKESRIVARLRPGENPAMLNMPDGPPNVARTPVEPPRQVESTLKEVEVIEESPAKKVNVDTTTQKNSQEKAPIPEEESLEKTTKIEVVEEKVEGFKEEIKEKATKLYIVKKGDTLYAIAKANKTTVEAIKEKNKLASNALFIGQKLKL